MRSTWQLVPEDRLTFEQIYQKLTEFTKKEENGLLCDDLNACQKFETFERTNQTFFEA